MTSYVQLHTENFELSLLRVELTYTEYWSVIFSMHMTKVICLDI